MNQNVLFRIVLDVLMVICVSLGWWYVALPIGLIALFKFSYYLELIVAGFAYDALFGMGSISGGSAGTIGFWSAYAGTLVAVVCSVFVFLIRKAIR